ncbi:phosphoribosylformylglycinamidine synthase subunit PurQ [Egicoccus halophilus]|uniref:Phosphoribosylformylglycinamidine synthase subunit PurQ n=1 Tax=Egicoccus halophilus TaxID=1670830 RepID=A0A8J3A7D3_9ACTN|nr:phosphoribosylformylglycinamidine synthase subunit PurQ [Egicoccus halophilus]GGI05579.1 phosphoribosylformylglycinamidine synthase subunit PurQ [Egicoccus halophilus]
MRVGVVTFPGSLDDQDAVRAVERCGGEGVALWHDDADTKGVDAVVLPGGFSYGDYLRTGAVAHRAPVMRAVADFAADGGPVLGICNGFQVLCEAGLLPGALLRNERLRFVCKDVPLVVEAADTRWTADYAAGEVLVVPAKHGEGRYYADEVTLDRLEDEGRVVVRYANGRNPNGSLRDIAGVTNEGRNVVGVMPHPEHAVDPTLIGGADGQGFFRSVLEGRAAPA